MANLSPILSDFLASQKSSGANQQPKTKSSLLPPVIAPGLFGSITGKSEQGNYGTLNEIGQRIQTARANSDADAAARAAQKREKQIMDMIKKIQAQAAAAERASRYSAPSSSSYNSGRSIGGGGGTSPLPVLNPPSPSGITLPDVTGGKISPPVVAPPAWHYCRIPPFNIPVPCW